MNDRFDTRICKKVKCKQVYLPVDIHRRVREMAFREELPMYMVIHKLLDMAGYKSHEEIKKGMIKR